MDYFGQVKILFSHVMETSFDLGLINQDVVDIFVEPAQDRHLEEVEEGDRRRLEGFDMNSLNLTWEVDKFEEKELVFNVSFNDPVSVSPLSE